MKAFLAGVGVIVVCLAIIQVADEHAPFLPPSHDPQLVGRWNGNWTRREWQPTGEIEFTEGGTGHFENSGRNYRQPFRWGTRNGSLYMEFFSVDSMVYAKARYSLPEPWGDHVEFKSRGLMAIPDRMTRK